MMRNWVLMIFVLAGIFAAGSADAQVLTGSLTGTAKDESGGVLPGAMATRILLERPGTRRLSSQTLVDLRVSRTSQTFARPSVFVDPRRAMLGGRMSFQ
jgi:hypothetical protein